MQVPAFCGLFVLFELLHEVVGFDGLLGEAIVVPPPDHRCTNGEGSGHQLFQLSRFNGQHSVAGGTQDLVGQSQSQHCGAGDGRGRDLAMFHRGYSFLRCGVSTDPAALGGADVDVNPARTLGCRGIPANPAPAGKQQLGIGCNGVHRGVRHPDVGGTAIEMLAVARGVFDCGVVGGGAVSAGQAYGLTEVIPDVLQDLHQYAVHKDRVGSVAAGKLSDTEVLAQPFLALFGERVDE